MQEVRIEDCTSVEAEMEVGWENTMRLMPPLLELMDMFNIVCRRSVSCSADTDLLKGAPDAGCHAQQVTYGASRCVPLQTFICARLVCHVFPICVGDRHRLDAGV